MKAGDMGPVVAAAWFLTDRLRRRPMPKSLALTAVFSACLCLAGGCDSEVSSKKPVASTAGASKSGEGKSGEGASETEAAGVARPARYVADDVRSASAM